MRRSIQFCTALLLVNQILQSRLWLSLLMRAPILILWHVSWPCLSLLWQPGAAVLMFAMHCYTGRLEACTSTSVLDERKDLQSMQTHVACSLALSNGLTDTSKCMLHCKAGSSNCLSIPCQPQLSMRGWPSLHIHIKLSLHRHKKFSQPCFTQDAPRAHAFNTLYIKYRYANMLTQRSWLLSPSSCCCKTFYYLSVRVSVA